MFRRASCYVQRHERQHGRRATITQTVWQPHARGCRQSEVAESRRKTHGFKCRCEDWARHPELRRRCACLHHGAILKRSTEYKVVARDQRNTNGELASDFHRRLQLAVSHVTSSQVGSAMLRPTGCPIREPAMRRVSPQADASCRRARSRQGRCAPLTRWAEDGPILDRRCARRPSERTAGAEEWLRPGRTKELEKEEEMKKNKNRS